MLSVPSSVLVNGNVGLRQIMGKLKFNIQLLGTKQVCINRSALLGITFIKILINLTVRELWQKS